MRWYLAAPVLLSLAACGTPQEQCIRSVSHDQIVLDRLIAQTQGNLARGYALVDTVVTTPEMQDCTQSASASNPNPSPQMCFGDVATTVTNPVAIDLTAEAAKLASMQQRRAQMVKELAPAVADCKARYPK